MSLARVSDNACRVRPLPVPAPGIVCGSVRRNDLIKVAARLGPRICAWRNNARRARAHRMDPQVIFRGGAAAASASFLNRLDRRIDGRGEWQYLKGHPSPERNLLGLVNHAHTARSPHANKRSRPAGRFPGTSLAVSGWVLPTATSSGFAQRRGAGGPAGRPPGGCSKADRLALGESWFRLCGWLSQSPDMHRRMALLSGSLRHGVADHPSPSWFCEEFVQFSSPGKARL